MKKLQLLAVASEMFPFVKTGGLADVVGALPDALAEQGIQVRTMIPGYPAVLAMLQRPRVVLEHHDLFGGSARVFKAKALGADLFVLDAPHLFDRPGGPYSGTDGRDWSDNGHRFAALSRSAADIALGAIADYCPDIVHAHDWQTGLVMAYLRGSQSGSRPGTVFTIHNLAFQGQFPADMFGSLGLSSDAFGIDGVEYYGTVSYLKAGICFADRVTSVSPSYVAEIRSREGGMGLDGAIRARGRDVRGILNGIDTTVWNPETDNLIPSPFSAARLGDRQSNKVAIQQEFGLDRDEHAPLLGIVSRLSWQKGVDLVVEILPDLLASGCQLAVLGSGDAPLEDAFRWASATYPGRVGSWIGYDEGRAHRMQAGADAILVPSRFEPCGLTQLCALRYGAVPVVARVGGLSDSIIDANSAALAVGTATGIQFSPVTVEMLRDAIERMVVLYRQPDQWRSIQTNGMRADVSWNQSARQYSSLFHEIVTERR